MGSTNRSVSGIPAALRICMICSMERRRSTTRSVNEKPVALRIWVICSTVRVHSIKKSISGIPAALRICIVCSIKRRRSGGSRKFLKSGRTKGIYGDKPRKSSEQRTTVAVLFLFFLVGWAINKAKFNWQLKGQLAVFFPCFLVKRGI